MKNHSGIKEKLEGKVKEDVMKSKMQKNIIIMMIFSVFIAVFALLNSAIVPINLIFTKLNLSAALVILISATIGAIIIYSFDAIVLYKLKKRVADFEKTLLAKEAELENMKESVTSCETELAEAVPSETESKQTSVES